jgi:integrase
MLKLVKRPKSDNWIIRGTLRGCRVEESTGVADRKVAEEIFAKRSGEILTESVYGTSVTMTFAHAAASYLENGGNHRFMTPVLDHFGTTLLRNIDQNALDTAAKKLYPKAGPATRNRQFYTPASAVLHHGAKRGWCSQPVIERPKLPPGRVRWITPEEANRLIDACSPHLAPLVTMLLYTGARLSEALYLDWRNVDLDRAHVQFLADETKTEQSRGVPLAPRVVAALAALKHREGAVFRTRGTKRDPIGQPYARKREGQEGGGQIKTAWKGACRRAGIVDFTPHDCRHTWATWHYQAHRDLGALQALGGWASLEMVMRYAHTNVANHAASITALPGASLGEIVGSATPEAAKAS